MSWAAIPVKSAIVTCLQLVRPGKFSLVNDCMTGDEKARIVSPKDRHFYGLGIFSSDGNLLFTTENDYEAGRGRIGVWVAQNDYIRIDEWDSGGIGPHDIKRLPETDMLVVANGGIDTHPETGRTKLNIPTMAPNLAYISKMGRWPKSPHLPQTCTRNLSDIWPWVLTDKSPSECDGKKVIPLKHSLASIRWDDHFDLWQPVQMTCVACRDTLAASHCHQLAKRLQLLLLGGIVQEYDVRDGELSRTSAILDVCGIAVFGQNITMSAGTGEMRLLNAASPSSINRTRVHWDNHLIPVSLALT